MPHLPCSTDLILVAIIPNPRDFEIARLFGWYRIPLRTAPKIVSVDYLAFYQPSSFKDRKWQVEFIAPVNGHELTTRSQLLKDEPDHPRAAEEYFKIQLGPLMPLPSPIAAGKWKRLNFLYTTGKRLMDAETLADLSVYDQERQILWQSLREKALQEQEYQTKPLPEFPVGEELRLLLGIMDLDQ